MSLVSMTLAAEGTPAQERSAASRRARYIRPALGLIVPVTLALAWETLVRLGWGSGRLAPPPSVIFQTFVDLARTGELQRDTLVTLGRGAAGFGLWAATGTAGGGVTGYSALLRRLLDPSLQGLRAIPSIAWIPLFILWLGIFGAPKTHATSLRGVLS